MNLIEGYVAQILNERSIVINKGSTAGVKIGMRFKVLSTTPLEVVDPITSDPLGELNREKIRVECTELYDTFSVCSTYVLKHIGGYFSGSAIFNELVRDQIVVETLRYDARDKPAPLSEEESIVKVGDKCIQIFEKE